MTETAQSKLKIVSLTLMGLLYGAAGVNHFVHPAMYVKIMPAVLPYPLVLVYISGVAEILLGLLLWVPRCTRWAAWGIIALLIAVYPANINMAMHPELTPDLSVMVIWLRLPLQILLIYWAYTLTRPVPKN